MRKQLLPVFCSLLLIPALTGVASGQALTADQIIEKHLTALGGREALGKITSRRATGTVSVSTPMGALGGPVEMMAKAPNKMRADIRIDLAAVGGPGEMVISEFFDGTSGWSLNSLQGDNPMAGDQLAGAKNNFFPSPLLKYKELGMTTTLEATQQVNGKPAHVILFTPKAGPAERMFFDAESFLIVRTTSSMTLPQVGLTETVSEPSDYRAVDGVKVAFKLAQSAGGQEITMTFTKIENNVALDDAKFVKK
jgi:outer membrane lipoprotein-sorting protein